MHYPTPSPSNSLSLQELGFCVHVKYPHKIIIIVLALILEQKQNTDLIQVAWNFMNDSLKTDVFLRYTPDQIGCACIWLAARMKKVGSCFREARTSYLPQYIYIS